jgi:phosphoenolpyruvate carboxylase
LDVRQDSSVHAKVLDSLGRNNALFPENYSSLTEEESSVHCVNSNLKNPFLFLKMILTGTRLKPCRPFNQYKVIMVKRDATVYH